LYYNQIGQVEGGYFDVEVIDEGDLLLARRWFAFLGILIKVNRSSGISAQTNNLLVRHEMERTYFESFLAPRLSTMNDLDLQSFQVAGKHPPFSIVQSGHVLRTRFPEDTSGEGDKVATLVHGTDCGIAIEIEFA
jgi:hypothetical protein